MRVRLDRVDERAKLKPRRGPYWHPLTQGRSVGYRRMTRASAGTWLGRFYDGARYLQKPLGDFLLLAEKERFDAAKRAAEAWFRHLDMGGSTETATVQDACRQYIEFLREKNSEASAADAQGRFNRLVFADALGGIDLAKLTPRHVAAWKTRVLARGGRQTFNRNAAAMKGALNLARSRGMVASDHAWREELKGLKLEPGKASAS